MAQSSFPFENIDTTETQYSQLFRTLNNGVNGTPDGGELEVDAASAGLAVDIAAGQAMVRGHFYISTAVETRSLAVADATNDRIDLVVLRLDPIANSVVLAVKTGVPDPAPVAPALVFTDGGIFEQPLAEVLVPANAGVPSTITDRREFMGTKLGTWTTDGRPTPAGRVLFGFNTTLEAVEFYNTLTDEWEEITPASIGDIGDVTLTSPSYGQVLSYNPAGDNFINNADNNPVMVFDDATARTTAIPTPVEGMVTYLKDTDVLEVFSGSAFVNFGSSAVASFRIVQTLYFTSSGTFTKASFPWLRAIRVRCQGGGGGGAGSGGNNHAGAGGGGGAYAERFITNIAGLSASETVTRGGGGAGGAAGNNNGSGGGASVFAALVSADGGGAGLSPSAGGSGGSGGAGATGDVALFGSAGGSGSNSAAGITTINGPAGGASHLGGSGRGAGSTSGTFNTGGNGNAFGGGGGGAFRQTANSAGGNGAIGIVIIDLFA